MSRILIVDDHLMYRKALRGALETHIGKAQVVEADNLESMCKRLDPDGCIDLSLIDLSTPGISFETLRELHECYPKTRFAAMMALATRADIIRSLDAGLHGFVSKSQSDIEILNAIKDILSGRVYVPALLTKVGDGTMNGSGTQIYGLSPRLNRAEAIPGKLTPRQREVLAMLARGMSNKEISRALRIAEGTTKIHASSVLKALGVRNRTEAAAIAQIHSVTADSSFRRKC
jgi:DNA-binding NarL/FixJ family response regulator